MSTNQRVRFPNSQRQRVALLQEDRLRMRVRIYAKNSIRRPRAYSNVLTIQIILRLSALSDREHERLSELRAIII
jgi:hypothetical protein